jgi:hypothetical protein
MRIAVSSRAKLGFLESKKKCRCTLCPYFVKFIHFFLYYTMAYDQFASPSHSFLTLSKKDPHKLLPHKLLHLQRQLSLPGQCSTQLKQLYDLCCMVYKPRSSSMTLYRIWKTSGQYSHYEMNVINLDVNAPVTRLKKQRHTRISTILRFTIQREDPGLSA